MEEQVEKKNHHPKKWNGNQGFELATSLEIHINRKNNQFYADA